MGTLRVDLQAHFNNDDVRVTLDGRELISRQGVTTDYSVGLAASVEHADVEPGDYLLEVSIPSRSLTSRRTITVTDETYLAVATDGDALTITTQTEPFIYF